MVIQQSVAAEATRRRGFTLTEAAIVLGIVGLILGAIWVAAAAVYNNLRVQKANTAILTVAQTIRSMHATQTAVQAAGASDWIAAGIWPADWITTTTTTTTPTGGGSPVTTTNTSVTNPWGNTTNDVFVGASAVVGDSFKIALGGVPQAACIDLLTRNTGAGRDSGLYLATANNTNLAGHATGVEAATTMPVSVANAATACNAPTNTVILGFRLKT